jgi:peptide/nickel transport system substrate-binding protein
MTTSGRISRRALLRAASLLATTSLLAACTPAAPPASPTTAPQPPAGSKPTAAAESKPADSTPVSKPTEAQPKRGGQMSLGIISDPTLNPFTWPGQFSTIMASKPIWNTLTKYEPGTMRTVPDLATAWEVAPDGLSWTFKLRQNVKWHDGKPFTAADVKFTLENLINPNVNALFRSNITGLKDVQIVDDYTVKLNLDKPFASLPIQLGYNIVMAPKHLLDGQDLNVLTEYIQNPIGTGPFKVKEIVRGSFISMEAFDDYYDGRPNLDRVVYKIIPEINTQVAQLRTGELDLALIEPANKETLKNQQNLAFFTVEQPNTFFFPLNNAREPFNDIRVRRALTLGSNRQLMVERILNGEAPLAAGAYGTAFGDFQNKELKPYPYDPERAKQLLAEAGWTPGADGILEKNGKKMSFGFMVDKGSPVREQMALAVQQDWKKLGIETKLEVEEFNVYLKRGNSRPGDYDARTGWRITAPDPDKTAEYTTEGALNHYMYSNPEVDRLMAEGRASADPQKRVKIYHDLQKLIYDDVPIIWVYYWTEIVALNKAINGLPQMGIRDALTYTNKLWRS